MRCASQHDAHVPASHVHQTSLPAGLSAATGLTRLYLDSNSLYLNLIWEQLQQLLPCWPLLHVSGTLACGGVEGQCFQYQVLAPCDAPASAALRRCMRIATSR